MLAKLRDNEHSQLIAEMRRRIAELELQNEDLMRSANQYRCNGDGSSPKSSDLPDLPDSFPCLTRNILRPTSLVSPPRIPPTCSTSGASSPPISAPPRRCRSSAPASSTHLPTDLTPTNEAPTADGQRGSSPIRRQSIERLGQSTPRIEPVNLCAGAT